MPSKNKLWGKKQDLLISTLLDSVSIVYFFFAFISYAHII